MAITSRVEWRFVIRPPKRKGFYVVSDGRESRIARYLPKLRVWKFPNDKMRIDIEYWAELPMPPLAILEAGHG
jgi:hypothetical protein